MSGPFSTAHVARIDAGIRAETERLSALSIRGRLLAFWRLIEPYYDWGTINTFSMNARREEDVAEGEVSFFDLQWLGLHLGLQIGRTPKLEA